MLAPLGGNAVVTSAHATEVTAHSHRVHILAVVPQPTCQSGTQAALIYKQEVISCLICIRGGCCLPRTDGVGSRLFPNGNIEPVGDVRFLTETLRARVLKIFEWLRVNPVALSLKGISRQQYSPASFVFMKCFPVSFAAHNPELPQGLQQRNDFRRLLVFFK